MVARFGIFLFTGFNKHYAFMRRMFAALKKKIGMCLGSTIQNCSIRQG